jgi:class 3 adenylate cyclase/TolB-like protein
MTFTPAEQLHWSHLQRVRRAVVVVDMVESVRLMQLHESDVIDRWRRFVHEVQMQILPPNGGRMIKHLGDGMLLVFDRVPDAAQAMADLHQRAAQMNEGVQRDAQIWLRIGANQCEMVYDEIDAYGAGVNIAARLATLSHPGESVVTTDFRDGLVPGLDFEVEDLGECQVKNLEGSVRAYRLGARAPFILLPRFDTFARSRPTIAVLPIESPGDDVEVATLAEIVTTGIINGLSPSSYWRVISRLSTQAFRDRRVPVSDLARHLGASFVLSGKCRKIAGRVRVDAEVIECGDGTLLWGGTVDGTPAEVLEIESPMTRRLVELTAAAIFTHELGRSRMRPLPTLSSHTLLFGAVSLMHRLSRNDFERSRAMLDHLCERHPRSPDPHAWRAKWHVMNVAQGWCHDLQGERVAGHASAQQALDEVSDHPLALAVDGLISAYLAQDLTRSERSYQAALAANPNESLAWLFSSALDVYRDRGEAAAQAADTAMCLSPLDPFRYYYDSFAAHAYVAAGRLDDAIRLAERSIRANCTHMATFRTLAVALVMAGERERAAEAVQRLLALDPSYSISRFGAVYPGRGSRHARLCVEALAEAGLPQ